MASPMLLLLIIQRKKQADDHPVPKFSSLEIYRYEFLFLFLKISICALSLSALLLPFSPSPFTPSLPLLLRFRQFLIIRFSDSFKPKKKRQHFCRSRFSGLWLDKIT